MQKLFGTLLLSSLSFTLIYAFIVPQEIPSLLSLVYSNIPPIKKGTDSRIGFGYRLGDHADFQVQFELGPQKETQLIGKKDQASKRNIKPADEFQIQNEIRRDNAKQTLSTSQTWLQNWWKRIKDNQNNDEVMPFKTVRSPMISESAVNQLKQLYKQESPKAESDIKMDPVHIV